MKKKSKSKEPKFDLLRFLRILGVSVTILLIWNGVADFIYAYSAKLSGFQYFSPMIWDVIRTSGGRPHWMVMLAQTAGWLYPIYAMSYFIWWVGMRRAGFWLSTVPCLILAYALFMIGGIQHAGFAFLSVLAQAKALVGSTDPKFYAMAQQLIIEHFAWGDLTGALALYVGPVWHAVGILSGRTIFPRWFVVVSPLGMLFIPMLVGAIMPAPVAGIFIALFGTWFMMVPTVAATAFIWNRKDIK